MKKLASIGAVMALLFVATAPAQGADFRDRLTLSGSSEGVTASGIVVDDDPDDFFSAATSHTSRCVGHGPPDTIVTLTSISLPDALVDVPQLLRGVEASGTGTLFVTVIDRCAPSQTTTTIEGVTATLSGVRTSKLDNLGNATFRGSGTGTLTVGDVTLDVDITFNRAPLP